MVVRIWLVAAAVGQWKRFHSDHGRWPQQIGWHAVSRQRQGGLAMKEISIPLHALRLIEGHQDELEVKLDIGFLPMRLPK